MSNCEFSFERRKKNVSLLYKNDNKVSETSNQKIFILSNRLWTQKYSHKTIKT